MMQFGMHYGSRVIQKTQANVRPPLPPPQQCVFLGRRCIYISVGLLDVNAVVFSKKNQLLDQLSLRWFFFRVVRTIVVYDQRLPSPPPSPQMAKYFFTLRGLHYYFTVNNSYVKNKLRLLIFPFRHKVSGARAFLVMSHIFQHHLSQW